MERGVRRSVVSELVSPKHNFSSSIITISAKSALTVLACQIRSLRSFVFKQRVFEARRLR